MLYIRTHNIEDKLSLVLATVVALIYDHLTSQNIILFIWGNILRDCLFPTLEASTSLRSPPYSRIQSFHSDRHRVSGRASRICFGH